MIGIFKNFFAETLDAIKARSKYFAKRHEYRSVVRSFERRSTMSLVSYAKRNIRVLCWFQSSQWYFRNTVFPVRLEFSRRLFDAIASFTYTPCGFQLPWGHQAGNVSVAPKMSSTFVRCIMRARTHTCTRINKNDVKGGWNENECVCACTCVRKS